MMIYKVGPEMLKYQFSIFRPTLFLRAPSKPGYLANFIFQTMAAKLHVTDNSIYFYDTELYDFGPQLLFHQDQKFVISPFFFFFSFNDRRMVNKVLSEGKIH